MATWPEANQKRTHARNATLELLTDRRDKDLRSGHSNPRHAAFENLVLSMEQDGQTLSEVSSLHTGSFYSQYDERLQVAVTSHSSTGESHSLASKRGSYVTIGCVSIFVTFLCLVIGGILVAIYRKKHVNKTVIIACELLRAAGLFGFTGGVTNWLGIKLIFNRIPGVFFSGAITKHFAVAKKLMANFILESFFSPLQVKKYINEKARNYLTPENIDSQLEKLLNSASAETMINEQLGILMGTPEGLRLRMLGITKDKLKPLVKPHLMNLKTSIVPLLLSSVESVELLNADNLKEQIVDLILTRTHELSAQQVNHIVKDAVYRHLSWIVFWGSVLGAIVGCLAELASVLIKGT